MLDPQIANRLAARSRVREQLDAEDEMDLLGGIPEYLQRPPADALDPYAHSSIDEPWEMVHDAPVPGELGGDGYSNMQLGDKIAPWVSLALLLGGAGAMRGPQLNPTVGLRAPANRDLIKSTQAPGYMRPVVDEMKLRQYMQDPVRHGAANLYAPHPQITNPWRASELEQQMLRAQYLNYPVGAKITSQQNPYNLLDEIPMVNVPRTQDLASAAAKLNAEQVARLGQGMVKEPYAPMPFPLISPPVYGPAPVGTTAGIAGELAAGAAGFDGGGQGSWMDRVLDSGLLGLLPYRDENTPYEKQGQGEQFGLADIADAAGEGVGSATKWLWDQGKKFTGRG
jgi:hypothetical protein